VSPATTVYVRRASAAVVVGRARVVTATVGAVGVGVAVAVDVERVEIRAVDDPP